jgi:hypothetical protein
MMHHIVSQNTPEWDALRLGRVTASNFGTIMANEGKAFGEPAKRYALQIALEAVTGRKSEYSFQSSHMERGHTMEPMARHLYEQSRFVDVLDGGFFAGDRVGYSPDGIIGSAGLIEIKSVIASVHEATISRGDVDPAYLWQLIGGLEVSGREWIDFVSYCSDYPEHLQLYVTRLERNRAEEAIKRLQDRRRLFIELVDEKIAKLRKP